MPPELRGPAASDGNTRGFVNERGRYLDRFRAADYARDLGLLKRGAPDYARTSPELIAEWLRPPDEQFARREGEPSPVVDPEARARLADAAQRVMRAAGLPSDVGFRLVDRIVDAAGNSADAHYTRSLISLALDTSPREMPASPRHWSKAQMMKCLLRFTN